MFEESTMIPHRRLAAHGVAAVLFLSAASCVSAQPVLFTDNFDAGSSAAAWSVACHAGDCATDFFFDYATRGIPPAPNTTGGTTRGLRLLVNANDAVAAKDAVSVYPVGQSFSGNYRLRFDLWMGYNGGAGGGVGSTQFANFGLNHAGDRVCWADNVSSDGLWFGVTGEGGDASDYRAYRGGTLLTAGTGGFPAGSLNHTAAAYQAMFPAPPYETAGAPGKRWVEVEVAQENGTVSWRINGTIIASRTDTTYTTGGVMLGLMDTFTSIATPATDTFALFDNVVVEAIPGPDCNDNGVDDYDEIAAGTAGDCDDSGMLDECESFGFGDWDGDGAVRHADYEQFVDCFAGPAAVPAPAEAVCSDTCRFVFDDNGDDRVDLRDLAALQLAWQVSPISPIPPRPPGALTGSQFFAQVNGMSLTQRDPIAMQQILAGNIPDFLREFVPVTVSATVSGSLRTLTFYVMPDYLAIGSDADFFRFPMRPETAQPIADAFDCLLTTRKMCNNIWTAAAVKLAPSPINPATTDITLVSTFWTHNTTIEGQRAGHALGLLVAGIKKDVVITPQLAVNPGRVAIYGWHQLNGTPIQPLYLGHNTAHVDYSHGIRLVRNEVLLDGVPTTAQAILAHPTLHVLLSDEGAVANPRYD
jgi:hypothetical protein